MHMSHTRTVFDCATMGILSAQRDNGIGVFPSLTDQSNGMAH